MKAEKVLQNEKAKTYCRDCHGETKGPTQCPACHEIIVKDWVKKQVKLHNLRPFKDEESTLNKKVKDLDKKEK